MGRERTPAHASTQYCLRYLSKQNPLGAVDDKSKLRIAHTQNRMRSIFGNLIVQNPGGGQPLRENLWLLINRERDKLVELIDEVLHCHAVSVEEGTVMAEQIST